MPNENDMTKSKYDAAEYNSSNQLRAIIENMNGGVSVVVYGDAGEVRIGYANDRYYELFGYTREQFNAELEHPHKNVCPDDTDYCVSMIDSVKKSHKPASFRYRAIKRDGSMIVVRCNASIASIGGLGDNVLISILTDITSSAEAEQKSLVARQRLRAILSHIASGVVAALLRDDGSVDYVFVSDRFFEMLGYTREQYSREVTDPFQLICDEYAETVRKEAFSLKKVGESKALIYRVMRRDGRAIWFRADITIMSFADVDTPVQLSVFTDVTASVEAENQLRAQEHQMERLMNETPGGIAVVEADRRNVRDTMRTTYYNDSFLTFSGYSREEYDALIRENQTHFVFDEDIPKLTGAIERVCTGSAGTTMDCALRCHTKNGGYRWLLLKSQLVARHGDLCIINVLEIDITDRKNTEDQLRVREEMLRIAAETDKRAIILYDVKANTCHVESRNLFSAKYGEVIENIPESLIELGIAEAGSIGELVTMFNRIKSGEERVSTSMQLRTGTTEYQWFELNAATVFDASGKPDHAVLVFHNITDQRLKEAVFKKWRQSIETRNPESYTLFRCNLSRDTSLDERNGQLLKIEFSKNAMSFNDRTKEYAAQCVYPDDRENYIALLDSDTLLAMFYRGKHGASLEYREMAANGALLWRLLTVELVEYLNSTDVQAFLMYEDINERKTAELKEREMAQTDPLTGVLNRTAFAEKVDELIKKEPNAQHAVLMIDMDGFKRLNDTFGHAAGDQALIDVTAVLRSLIRDGDLVGRLGGDEFFVWLRDIPYDAVIGKIARQMCEQVHKVFSHEVQISASIGVSVYPRDGQSYDELYHKADKALYGVKQSGKDNYAFFSGSEVETTDDSILMENTSHVITKSKRRMLIVDDNEINRMTLAGIFQDEYQIDLAKNGTDAMIQLRHFSTAISIVLLDLIMPGMDGFEVLKKMQDNVELRTIPVIVVSGDENHKTLLRAIEGGAADYVTKPVDTDLIQIRVKSAVSKAENERLRAQNSYLQLQRDEELKYRTVLESTGTVVIEYDWRNHVFIYDDSISKHIAGNYGNRSLWNVFLTDMVAESTDVKSLQEMLLALANDREKRQASKLVMLLTPENNKHWFRMSVYKQVDAFGLAEKMIITFNDVHADVLANDKLLYQAQRDELTGLYNRNGFIQKAEEMIAKKEPGYYVLSSLDIERFKVINDQYGTKKGDDVLRKFAKALTGVYDSTGGICCRIAADNFALLFPRHMIDTQELSCAHQSLEVLDGSLPPLKISVGRCIVDDKTLNVSAIYDRASLAKETVKGRYDKYIATYDESMRMALLRQQEITGRMNSALANGQFEVWIQPQFNHVTGMLSGAEALVRWRHPRDGIISPAEFIPIFEKNGFIYKLDQFVWERTCQLLHKWLSEGLDPVPVSVNISRYDVFRDDLVDVITGLVKKYDLPVNLLRLEITESAFTKSTDQIIRVVKRLVDLGFTVEIDDFGSGYSSLNTLKDVPAQVIKMDMRFLENDTNAQRGGSIIESVVRMARWLDMTIIAEGVEKKEQADYLKSIGCAFVQGFLYSRPIQVSEYEKLFADSKTEPKIGKMQTVEVWNNNAFWNPKSMDSLIFNSYVGGACIFEYHNGATEILRANRDFRTELRGLAPDEYQLSKTDFIALLDDENHARLHETVRKAAMDKQQASCELVVSQYNHTEYIRITIRMIAKATDRMLFYAVILNMTEQREAERKLIESAKRLEVIIGNINGGVSALKISDDGHSEVVFANDRYFEIFGYSGDQARMERLDVMTLIIPEDFPMVMDKINKLKKDGIPVAIDYRCRRLDGHIVSLRENCALMSMEGYQDDVVTSVVTDITELRDAQQNEQAAAEKLRTVLNHTGNGITAIALCGEKPEFLFANDKYFEIVGYSREEYRTATAESMFAPIYKTDRERIQLLVTDINTLHKNATMEYRIRQKNGNVVWVRSTVTITNLMGIDSPVQVATFSDITAEKEANEQLHFLNDSAHDILAQTDSEMAINGVLMKLMGYFAADRGYVVELDHVRHICKNTYEVCADGVASEMELLKSLPFSTTDYWYVALNSQKYFIIEDIDRLDERESELKNLLAMQDIRSLIFTPLQRDGALIGFVGVDNPRRSTKQIDRLTALSDYIAVLITRRDLTNAINREKDALRQLINDTPGGFCRMEIHQDKHPTLVMMNEGFCRMLGMTEDEVWANYGDDMYRCLNSQDIAASTEDSKNAHFNGGQFSTKCRLLHKDGSFKWTMVFGRFVNGENGSIYLNSYFTDISVQKKAEEQQKELLDNLPQGAAMYDFDGKTLTTIHINRQYEIMTGRVANSSNTCLAPIEYIHPDDRKAVIDGLCRAISENRNGEIDIRVLYGQNEYRFFHVDARVTKKENGHYLLFVTYTHVSEQEITLRNTLPYVFSAMMEGSTDVTFAKDRRFRYICCSQAYARVLGIENPKSLIGKTDFELFSKEFAQRIRAEDMRLVEDGKPIIDKLETMPTDTGLLRYTRSSKYLLKDKEGNVLGIYGIGRDITQRQETSDQLKLLTDTLPGGIASYLCSPKGVKLAYCNNGFCSLFGMSGSEFAKSSDKDVMAFVYEQDREILESQYHSLMKNGTLIDCIYRIHVKDGSYKWIHHTGQIAERNKDTVVVNAVLLDITDKQEAQERLRVSEELNRLALEHSGSIITRFDVKTRTLTLPAKFSPIFDIPHVLYNMPQEQIDLGRVSPETADVYTELFESIVRGSATGSAVYQQNSTKGWRWLDAQYTTVFSNNAEPVSAVISFSDVTEKLEKDVVYTKWQQSLLERPEDSYTLFRCNLSRDTSLDSCEGKLINVDFNKQKETFDERTEEYVAQRVCEIDRDRYRAFLNSNRLLADYYRGRHSDAIEYRECSADGNERWLRLTVDLVEYPNSKDIEAYLMYENIDERKKADLLTLERAQTDPLTGVLNRTTFIARMESTLSQSKPGDQHALFMMDIDDFKHVNDTLGHGAGDKLLCELTKSINAILRGDDLIGRLGGDEFFVLLTDIRGKEDAIRKAKQICALKFMPDGSQTPVTASMGIAMIPDSGTEFDTLYRKVDAALYNRKKQGKNGYLFAEE